MWGERLDNSHKAPIKIKKGPGRATDYLAPGKMELEAMSRYTSPVNPAVLPHLTVALLAIRIFSTAWFFMYEVTFTKYTGDIYK